MIRESWDHSLDEELDLQRDAMRELGFSDDYREGVAAFMEKRTPSSPGASDHASRLRLPDIGAQNVSKSMLPPEQTQTIGPSRDFPVSAAAKRQRARAFGDRPRLLGDQPHRLARLIERDGDRAVDHRPHPLPHPLA